mmetsp:Transcript_2035/g.6063  ORF Transcript_2035/g.6063 Transcript_2035/m.6063 type:complete len:258 (-) Transcript_2035:291-1064(-)
MGSLAMRAPGALVCDICDYKYTEARLPKLLPCGHTLCNTCLEAVVNKQQMGSVHCPHCNQSHTCDGPSIFPCNYALRGIIDGQVAAGVARQPNSSPVTRAPKSTSPLPRHAEPRLACVLDHALDPSITAQGGLVGYLRGREVQYPTNGHKSWTLLRGGSSITVTFTLNGPMRPLTVEWRARTDSLAVKAMRAQGQAVIITHLNGSKLEGLSFVTKTDYDTYKVALPKDRLQEDNVLTMSMGQVSTIEYSITGRHLRE